MSSHLQQSEDKRQLMMLIQEQRFEEACQLGETICERNAGDAEAWFLLGAVHGQLGNYPDAENCCRRALGLQPEHPALHHNLAVALLYQDKLDAASDSYLKALKLSPGNVSAYNELAAIYIRRRFYVKAVELLEKALIHLPGTAELYLKLGLAHFEDGKIDEALLAYQRVLELCPQHVDATYALGRIKRVQGHLGSAIEYLDKAVALAPDHGEALAVLGGVKKEQGKIDEALVLFRKALRQQPGREDIHSSFLLNLNYTSDTSAQECFSEHLRWNRQHAGVKSAYAGSCVSRAADRRLRVGYISPDFRTHSVAYFFEPLLASHNRSDFECYCYADFRLHREDSVTARLKSQADRWIDATLLSDADLAEQIRADRIDILVDLAGHTAGNRLSVFGMRSAPIQVTYLGYPNTTGLDAMDYRITDSFADPEGETEQFHTETLIRLRDGFLCYQPPACAPDPGRVPALSNGFITFGSFNNLAKVTPEVIGTWADLLNTVPGTRLLLKNGSFRDEATRECCYDRFRCEGVARERLGLMPGTASLEDHLAAYNGVDIAVDTFPYNGTTTTFEALWMGVPVVTLRGSTHAGRVGLSILSHLGLDNLVAASSRDYIEILSGLAVDYDLLEKYRSTLRERLRMSPLCDAKVIASNIEAGYRRAWQDWCSQPEQ